LADIPYDGYHTDYSLWALEYANQQQDEELVSPESAAVESLRSLGSLGSHSSPDSIVSAPSLPDMKRSTYLYELTTKSVLDSKATPIGNNEPLGLPLIKQLGTAEAIEEAKGVDRADDAGGFQDADEVDQAARANETAEVDQARLDQVDEAGETDPKNSAKTESRNGDPHRDGKSYDR
jgi:hypothetical protein